MDGRWTDSRRMVDGWLDGWWVLLECELTDKKKRLEGSRRWWIRGADICVNSHYLNTETDSCI